MKKMLLTIAIAVVAIELAMSCAAVAEVLNLEASEDTYLSTSSDLPTGAFAELVVGTQGSNASFAKNRGLLRFTGISQIPAGSRIVSATVRIAVTKTPSLPADSNFHLHRMLSVWDESASTWNLRLPPDQGWGEPGGKAGVDYVASSSASQLIEGLGDYSFSSSNLVADITEWLNHPAQNQGWLLKTEDESVAFTARRLAASEGTGSGPTLEIEYQLTEFRIASSQINQGQFCLSFDVEAGHSYTVERRPLLGSGDWSVVQVLDPAPAPQRVTVCDPLGATPAFYRVVKQ